MKRIETMKNELTLEYLAPYLPHRLKALGRYPDGTNSTREIHVNNVMGFVLGDISSKPILRPLSDLTKEIEHNGERFVPAEKLQIIQDTLGEWSFDMDEVISWEILHATQDVQKLFEWHFDVFGLIEKGLAVDINTIQTETT